MANLLLVPILRVKIDEVLGTSLSDLWLDIAWDSLVSALGYDPSFGEKTDETIGTGDEIVYLEKRPVKTLIEVIRNNAVKEITDYKIYKESACKYLKGIFYQGTLKHIYGSIQDLCVDERLEITYEGGYTADEFPNDLLLLICDMLQSALKTADGSSNLSSYSISDISYKFKDYTEKSIMWDSVLDKYRNI